MNNRRTALYRHYNAANELLYVGISLSVVNRLSQHKSSGWSADIAKVEIEHFENRMAALNAETLAIKTEKPVFNIAQNNDKHLTPKPKVKVLSSVVREFEEMTQEEKRLIWACVSLKNDIEEHEELTRNFRMREVNFVDKFVITDTYFSKLFGASEGTSFKSLHKAAKALSKCVYSIEYKIELTDFVTKKIGWVDLISHGAYRDIAIPDRYATSHEFVVIKFNKNTLDKFQSTPITDKYFNDQELYYPE